MSSSSTDKPTKARVAKSAAAKAAASARGHAYEKAAAAGRMPSRELSGFMEFVRNQGVVGLAVGLVLGTQIKSLVDQLLASFVNPLLGLVLPGEGDLAQKNFSLTIGDETAVFAWGQFAYILMSFMVVAAIIYYIVKGLKLDRIDKKDV